MEEEDFCNESSDFMMPVLEVARTERLLIWTRSEGRPRRPVSLRNDCAAALLARVGSFVRPDDDTMSD